jgi:Rieske 2Fe-2S family protein
VAATRRPTLEATTLPARVHLDPNVFQYEMDAWWARHWLVVGREDELPESGSYIRRNVLDTSLFIVRGADDQLRAFHNVCRHRGATIVQDDAGRAGGFSCPYHAWTYSLDGKLRRPQHTDQLRDFDCDDFGLNPIRLATMAGFVLVNLDPLAEPFSAFAGRLPDMLARFRLPELRRVKRTTYDVAANWKVIVENALECYHCPGVHTLLTKLTPPGMGGVVATTWDWSLTWMNLGEDYETMSLTGRLNGRPPIPSLTGDDLRRVYYVWMWPNLLFSINPDYMRALQVWPVAAGRSRIDYDVFFHTDAIGRPGFDPSDVIDFADLIVREDIRPCELQQQGMASRGYIPGRYAQIEGATHRFDARCADLYAGDGMRTEIQRDGDYYRSIATHAEDA